MAFALTQPVRQFGDSCLVLTGQTFAPTDGPLGDWGWPAEPFLIVEVFDDRLGKLRAL